jgi:peptide/nickel transport system permease protein
LLRYTFNRLIILPVGLLLGNILSYAFAFYIGPVQSLRNPYSYGVIDISNFWIKYWDYLQGAIYLNFGRLPNNELIQNLIARTSVASLGLLLISTVLGICLGVGIGVIAVRIDPPRVSAWLTVITTAGLASPGFFVGIVLISISINLLIKQAGSSPLVPFQGFGWDAHLILPVLTLTIQPAIKISRISAGMLEEELGKLYVTVARSFGHSWRSVRFRQAFHNILIPVLSTATASFRVMIAELIIVERLFNWPGLGKLLSSVLIMSSDSEYFLNPPLFATLISLLVLVFLITDLISGILGRVLDPRLRTT